MAFWVLGFAALVLQGSAARSVELWSDEPFNVGVEWLTIDARGAVTVTAQRQVTGSTPEVPFTVAADRFVRFSYPGVSPRTYSTGELALYKRLRVPDVMPGGELLLLIPPAAVRPSALDISGPRVRTIHLSDAISASLAGVPAGRYRVTPVYTGGIKGDALEFAVSTAVSTAAPMRAEPVGAAHILAEPSVCAAASEVTLDLLMAPAVAPGIKTPPNRGRVLVSTEPRCELLFAGLLAGTYEVSYRTAHAGLGQSAFEIREQAVSTVQVKASGLRVSGRVTLNDAPLADALVTFLFLGSDRTPAGARSETRTDGGGFYAVTLEAAGRYLVTARSGTRVAMFTGGQRAVFTDGPNTFDLRLSGGTIAVRITGWDRRGDIGLSIKGGGSMAMMTWGKADSPDPRTINGLPFGQYEVTVTQAGSAGPPAQTVTLTPQSPTATVTFVVSRR